MWKLSAATILCVPDLCTKERIAEIKGTPFYKDPTYQPVGINASHVNNKLTPYSGVGAVFGTGTDFAGASAMAAAFGTTGGGARSWAAAPSVPRSMETVAATCSGAAVGWSGGVASGRGETCSTSPETSGGCSSFFHHQAKKYSLAWALLLHLPHHEFLYNSIYKPLFPLQSPLFLARTQPPPPPLSGHSGNQFDVKYHQWRYSGLKRFAFDGWSSKNTLF